MRGDELAGRCILMTRSRTAGSRFVARVEAMGGVVVECEVRKLVSTGVAVEPDDSEWVLFASANAVDFFFGGLGHHSLSPALRFACVGDATAEALRGYGVDADLIPERKDAEGVAEAVADRKPRKVLVPRAVGGRTAGIELLQARGIEVHDLQIYRSVEVAAWNPALSRVREHLAEGRVDAVAVFAPSQVRSLKRLFGELTIALPMVAIGPTTRAAAEAEGYTVRQMPSRPESAALAMSLVSVLGSSHV